MAIEEHLLLYYPLPRYFWFSKTDRGRLLRERVEVGLQEVLESGVFDEHFEQYFSEKLEGLHLQDRVLIKLENPIYSDSFEKADEPYKFNPIQ